MKINKGLLENWAASKLLVSPLLSCGDCVWLDTVSYRQLNSKLSKIKGSLKSSIIPIAQKLQSRVEELTLPDHCI